MRNVRASLCSRVQAKGTGGARGYLAVSGGLDMPVYLGSRATFPGGKLGGVQACLHIDNSLRNAAVPLPDCSHWLRSAEDVQGVLFGLAAANC